MCVSVLNCVVNCAHDKLAHAFKLATTQTHTHTHTDVNSDAMRLMDGSSERKHRQMNLICPDAGEVEQLHINAPRLQL